MHDGLAILNAGGEIQYLNPRFAEILQREQHELIRQPLQKFTSGISLREFPQQLAGVWKSAKRTWELSWIVPSGTCVTLAAFGKTLGDLPDESLFFLVITDITPLKAAERRLQEAHDDLELRVRERTRELTESHCALEREIGERRFAEERNRQLQTELAHASRVTSLGQLATGLAHEINQPLCAIANFAEALSLMVEGHEPEIRTTAGRIRDASLRAGQIVGRMRNFLKPKSAQRVPETLNPLIDEVLAICSSELKLRAVDVKCALQEIDQVLVSVDSIQIQQVLINLVQNAIQAMSSSSGPRVLRILGTVDGTRVNIAVEDTGPGFPADMLGPEFAPFRTTKESGLGMGLSISRSLIVAHEGDLWIENLDPRGARISFTLPKIDEFAQLPHTHCLCGR
jgi:C4-dicarboxylate-specific signal transduction histidine kinase